MSKLGKKHECCNCGTRFYDLGRKEPICPKCGVNQDKPEEEPAEKADSPKAKGSKAKGSKAKK